MSTSADYDAGVCGKCGHPSKRVDLYGTPFFTHKPRRDRITYWHVDQARNYSHQAVPTPVTPPASSTSEADHA